MKNHRLLYKNKRRSSFKIMLSIVITVTLVLGSFSVALADQTYVVKSGDTLSKISKKHKTTYEELAKYNNIKNPDLILVNQVIKIPEGKGEVAQSVVLTSDKVLNPNAADTVLKNGVIYTIDDKNSIVQAVAIKDDKIVFVGKNADVEGFIGSKTKVVDLKGKVVLPGFVDSHVHRAGTALTELFEIYLYESTTKEKTLAEIKDFVAENPDLEIYWGTGFSVGIGGDPRGPKREWLDEISMDKPIILKSNDGHNRWLNTKALEMNGITKDTKAPTGGFVHKDSETGELWGTITDASSLIKMQQTFEDWQINKAMEYFIEYMNDFGYTSIMSISNTYLDAFKALEKSGDLSMWVNAGMQFVPDSSLELQIKQMNKNKDDYDSKLIDITTVKFFADGVVEGMTGYLLEPYADTSGMEKGYVSEPYWEQKKLNDFFDRVLAEGYQIHIHSIGDAATESMLDGFEYAQAKNGNKEFRNVLTHLQVVQDSDKVRMGKLDIIGSTQPFWHFKEPDWWDYVDLPALGEKRAWEEYPVKSLLDNGVMITFSGDHPVSPINNPFWAIEASVTRNLNNADFYGVDDIKSIDDPTWLLNPKERISVLDAVKAYTINGAYQLFRDESIGSLEAGKYADIIVIDQDIFKINPLKIDSTKTLTTIFNGEVVSGSYNY